MPPDLKNVKIVYTNWRGEKSERHIVPIKIWFGNTDWHAKEQWLLKAFDVDKQAERDFSLIDIHEWQAP